MIEMSQNLYFWNSLWYFSNQRLILLNYMEFSNRRVSSYVKPSSKLLLSTQHFQKDFIWTSSKKQDNVVLIYRCFAHSMHICNALFNTMKNLSIYIIHLLLFTVYSFTIAFVTAKSRFWKTLWNSINFFHWKWRNFSSNVFETLWQNCHTVHVSVVPSGALHVTVWRHLWNLQTT